jgi:ATP-binding cassette, subfamily B, bacterial
MRSNNLTAVMKNTAEILKLISQISKMFFPLVIVKNVLQATIPYVNIIFSYLILDDIVSKGSKAAVLSKVYWMIGLNLGLGLLLSFITRLLNVRTEYINHTMKSEIAGRAQTLDYEQLEKKENLEFIRRAEEGIKSHGGIMSFCNTIGGLITNVVTIVYSIILLSSLFTNAPKENPTTMERIFNSPLPMLAFVILFAASLFVNYRFLKKINTESYGFFQKNVDSNRMFFYFAGLSNNYNFGKDIRIYDMADMIQEEMNHKNNLVTKMMRELSITYGKYSSLTQAVNQFVIFTAYAFVGVKAILGLVSIGSVLKYISTLIRFINAMSNITTYYTNLDLQRQYLNNYCLFLKLENKKYEGTLPIEKRDDNEYELELKNVSFHYPNSEEMILNNISLKLKVGNKMAIVGQNGAGKTTFIKLLCRLYDPTEGEILLNGINIKKYEYSEYLKVFSVVFQDFKLFSFDIGQNVAANIKVDEAKVWSALEHSGVAERVKTMDKGINTNIYQNEENGIEISGGEAQKIAIARALYKDAPVVILDEPTSALDPVAEYEIYERFDHMVSEKTAIYISHRMSSCRFCDNIVVFDKGQIVQAGSHERLMKDEQGLYHKLWTEQSKYYK